MRYGLDFGTSNSAIGESWTTPEEPILLKVNPQPGRGRAEMLPSLLYIAEDGKISVGQEAADDQVSNLAGKEIGTTHIVSTQEIETVFGTEVVQFEVDSVLPGRFFQSLKSFLTDEDYQGTAVFGQFYTLEQLIAILLKELRERANVASGQEIDAVLMGRPVRFSDNQVKDARAEARLRKAAQLAGFKDIKFQYEPVAAALLHEATLEKEELALVFDFGGGTLDFTVMHLHPGKSRPGNRQGDILSTSGLTIGGNTIDEDIMVERLFKYFGEDVHWSDQRLPMPRYIFDTLRNWYTVPMLNKPRIMRFLEEVETEQGSLHKQRPIRALQCLIRKNYGYLLFQEIERSKVGLSTLPETTLLFYQEAIAINERIRRLDFEFLIAERLAQIERGLDATLASAGVSPDQIEVILRTGGSSFIPATQKLLSQKFPRAKLLQQDAFLSVAGGLAIAARNETWL